MTRTAREVQHVVAVEAVVPAEDAALAKLVEAYTGEQAEYNPGDDVVFDPDSLYELENPIPLGEAYPRAHRYTELGKLKDATVTDDLF